MIDRSHDLPVARQASALGISRGSIYYLPRPVSASDLALMRRIDALHLEFPFAGSRMLRDLLAAEGIAVGRLHVATLMKRMGIEALYRRPSTSRPAPKSARNFVNPPPSPFNHRITCTCVSGWKDHRTRAMRRWQASAVF